MRSLEDRPRERNCLYLKHEGHSRSRFISTKKSIEIVQSAEQPYMIIFRQLSSVPTLIELGPASRRPP